MNSERAPSQSNNPIEGESLVEIEPLNAPVEITDEWSMYSIGSIFFAEDKKGGNKLEVDINRNKADPAYVSLCVGDDRQNRTTVKVSTSRESVRGIFALEKAADYSQGGIVRKGNMLTMALPGTDGKRGLRIAFNKKFQDGVADLDTLFKH